MLALIDDYDRALAAFPAAQALVGDPMTARSDQRLVLEAFAKILGREAHNLTPGPDLLWQQMYNRLQWVDGPENGGVVSGVLAPELEERSKPGAGLWLHLLTRLRESGALIRVLAGHTGLVGAVAYSPDGSRIVSGSGTRFLSGSEDNTLKVWDAVSGAELATLTGHTGHVSGRRLLPGRQPHRLRLRRQHSQDLGRRQRRGASHPQRPHGLGVCRRLLPGRQPHRLRLRRQHSESVAR